MNYAPVKIVTHPGAFHADEVSAIALILIFYPGTPVERRLATPEDLEDPNVWVLDQGRENSRLCNNFDHHQDANSPATNLLILEELQVRGLIKVEVGDILAEKLFNYVSDVDRGIVIETSASSPTINGLIRSCNSMKEAGWETALAIATASIKATFAFAEARQKSASQIAKCEVFKGGKVLFYDSSELIADWREAAVEAGYEVQFLVTPNTRAGYQVVSADSTRWNIPADHDPERTFRHNSGFMAVYVSAEKALHTALALAEE